ncbi:MAG: hypothetical protein JWP01_777 [Myxococcales bacterium]|nr:hypothetical protein [Myxococcales bacterium]
MKLVGRVPVEPLDEERMTQIERRVVSGAADASAVAQPMRVSRGFTGVALAAMTAVAAAVIGWKLGSRPAPVVVGASTPVRIHTEAQRSTLDIGDATIESDPATVFVVTRPAGGVLVEMTRGKVELEVGKRGDRAPLVVRAGDTDVIVVGTHFTVDYGDGTGDVEVRVTEGVVKVVRTQHEVRVAAGQAWQTRRGVLARAEARTADGLSGPGPSGSGTTTTATSTTGVTDTAEGSTQVVASTDPVRAGSGFEVDLLHGRTSLVPDKRVAGNTTTVVASTGTTATTQPGTGGSGASTTRGDGTGAAAGTGSGARPAPRPVEDPSDPMRDLKKLVRSQPLEPALDVGESSAASAISAYYTIIRDPEKRGADESRAYYSIAVTQLKAERTGDALSTLERYFRRFSREVYPERTPALWLRVRILCTRSIDDVCRQAAYKYAHEAPGTPAAAVAERITLTD